MSLISERLLLLLKTLNISQKEFARRTGVKESSITDIKKNRYEPSASTILKICDVYDVDTNWLLQGKGSMFLSDSGIKYEGVSSLENLTKDDLIELVITVDTLDEKERDVIITFLRANLDSDAKKKLKEIIEDLKA